MRGPNPHARDKFMAGPRGFEPRFSGFLPSKRPEACALFRGSAPSSVLGYGPSLWCGLSLRKLIVTIPFHGQCLRKDGSISVRQGQSSHRVFSIAPSKAMFRLVPRLSTKPFSYQTFHLDSILLWIFRAVSLTFSLFS